MKQGIQRPYGKQDRPQKAKFCFMVENAMYSVILDAAASQNLNVSSYINKHLGKALKRTKTYQAESSPTEKRRLSIYIDSDIKSRLQAFAEGLGITAAKALNTVLKHL